MMYSVFALITLAILAVFLWPIRHKPRIALTITAFFLMAGITLYSLTGSPSIVDKLTFRNARLKELREDIIAHSNIIKTEPKNLDAWVQLGADFMESGQFNAAANAFKQGVLLSKGDPRLILAYARAMILEDGGKVSDHAKKSLQMVLLQDPQNADAKYFLTLRKLQDGDREDAMRDMKALYKSLPEGSPLKEMIDAQIGRR